MDLVSRPEDQGFGSITGPGRLHCLLICGIGWQGDKFPITDKAPTQLFAVARPIVDEEFGCLLVCIDQRYFTRAGVQGWNVSLTCQPLIFQVVVKAAEDDPRRDDCSISFNCDEVELGELFQVITESH